MKDKHTFLISGLVVSLGGLVGFIVETVGMVQSLMFANRVFPPDVVAWDVMTSHLFLSILFMVVATFGASLLIIWNSVRK